MFQNRYQTLHYLGNCKSEISIVCRAVAGHCLQAIKIVHHHADGCYDWLLSGHQNVNLLREAISITVWKIQKIYVFVHPVNL